MNFIPEGKYRAQKIAKPETLDSASTHAYWNMAKVALAEEGYFSPQFSVNENQIDIQIGVQSQWVVIPPQKGPDGYAIEGGTLVPSTASKLHSELIAYYSQKGYPFVVISHDVTSWKKDTLTTQLNIDLGPYVTIDSIVVKGMPDARESWIEKYTEIKKGDPYNSVEISKINRRLNQLGYVQMTREPAMIFSKEKNVLFLYGKYRSSNRFDGLIGLNTDDEGNAFFTGELDLGLQNIFKRGEQIDLAWRSPGQGSQELNARVAWPFLFSTPAGIEVAFDLFRRDSTFSSRNFSALATYLVSPELIAKVGYQGDASNPLGSSVQINTGNSSINWFVLGADYRDFTGDIIPRKGWTAFAEISQGSRSAEGQNSTVYKAILDVERFQPLSGNHHLYFKGTAHYLLGADFFENEIFREGGIHSMRGFNEQSLITPQFTRLTLSYRYFIETNSYFEIFNDVGSVVNQGLTTETTFLWGTGAGLGFQTRGGIFTLAYALGRTDQTPFDLRTGKVHLGYINQF
ncbi:MAG: hypothetical protein SchgKO_05390 [Schleiferiaceae bacterium]